MKQDLKIKKFDKNEWKIKNVNEKWKHEWKQKPILFLFFSNTNKKEYKANTSINA